MVEKWIFATPHTYYQGFKCPKGIQFSSKFDPKSDVKTDTPERLPFYGPKNAPKRKRYRKGSQKGSPRGSQSGGKMAQSDVQEGLEIRLVSKGAQVGQMASGGRLLRSFGT